MVVKANYIQVGKGNSAGRGSAFAAVNYMMFRPSEDGENRKAFDGERLLEPHEVHQRVGDQAQAHKYAYRMVMSPDRNFGEKTTEQWASDTLKKLGYDNHVVVSHAGGAGHTAHPHAHALVFTDARLERLDFQQLREFGDVQAKEFEMRLRHDRHMDHQQWRAQLEDELGQWRLGRDRGLQIKSDGVDDLSQQERRDRQTKADKQVSSQVGMEM
ncbi:Relaxase/mobilization nuclease domain-containing protein [Deinococcus saxicola]